MHRSLRAGEEGRGLPGVASKGRVMQDVETIVVGDNDVSHVFQQQRQHVVSLLADGVMQRSISLGIL